MMKNKKSDHDPKMEKRFKRGELWRFNPDPIVGREQAKVRPCLIISSNQFNSSPADLLIVLPLTSTNRGIPSHIEINCNGLKNKSYIMCEQIRSVSKLRFYDKLGEVDDRIMEQVIYWVSLFLDISSNGIFV